MQRTNRWGVLALFMTLAGLPVLAWADLPAGYRLAQKLVTVSMARTALLVMSRRVGQRSSPVRRYLSQQKAMRASSDRFWLSPTKISG